MSTTIQLTPAQLRREWEAVQYAIFELVVQTFAFGAYSLLLFLSTRMFLKRGLKARINMVLLCGSLLMYLISALYFAYSVDFTADRMSVFFASTVGEGPGLISSTHDSVTEWSPLFNAIVLVNYVLGDCVVIWRTMVISPREYRKWLRIPIVLVGISALSAICTIIFRAIGTAEFPFDPMPDDNYLTEGIEILQFINLGTSLFSNITATTIVAVIAYQHRKVLRQAFKEHRLPQGDRILRLLVDSGLLYCISQLATIIFSAIRLPLGTLGDVYSPVSFHIAGAYPLMIFLLVKAEIALDQAEVSLDLPV
uniref:Uncharacterized protein n=1 Tax=Mycena chlorophos TaxID=658473 RepID=A0ABQ0M8X7_MYCCL|nr:predicted protein [Mycena chlorophos]